MAISASTVFEIRTGGADTNGGGFVTGASGTDRTLQDAAHATLSTSSVVNSTTTIIDVDAGDYTCTAADVGNILQITGGTATAGFYQITARSAQQWTLDRSCGTVGQTVVGAMGGALATPGKLSENFIVDGNKVWVKSGTYTLSTSTPGSGGPCNINTGIDYAVIGYNSTRGDLDGQTAITNKPVLDAGAQTGVDLWSASTNSNVTYFFANLVADGNSGSSNVGFNGPADRTVYDCCHARDCAGTGFETGQCHGCDADTCGVGFTTTVADNCVAHDCTSHGFDIGTGAEVTYCLACGNGGDGIKVTTRSDVFKCVSHGNTGDGISISTGASVVECVVTSNGAYGVDAIGNGWISLRNAHRSNTSGFYDDTPNREAGTIALTADPYEDAASGDFRPNNTSGGGAELRGAAVGYPGMTSNQNIGGIQHADPSGGGGTTGRQGLHAIESGAV